MKSFNDLEIGQCTKLIISLYNVNGAAGSLVNQCVRSVPGQLLTFNLVMEMKLF